MDVNKGGRKFVRAISHQCHVSFGCSSTEDMIHLSFVRLHDMQSKLNNPTLIPMLHREPSPVATCLAECSMDLNGSSCFQLLFAVWWFCEVAHFCAVKLQPISPQETDVRYSLLIISFFWGRYLRR